MLVAEPAEAVEVADVVVEAATHGVVEIDPATIDVTDLELPAGVPKTGELTPSEAAGLGFEDFSGIAPVAAAAAAAGDAAPAEPVFDEPFIPFDHAPLSEPESEASLANAFTTVLESDAGDERHL